MCVLRVSRVTSLAADELVSAVLHQLQDPLVLSVDTLPRRVAWSMQVREVPTRAKTEKKGTFREERKKRKIHTVGGGAKTL